MRLIVQTVLLYSWKIKEDGASGKNRIACQNYITVMDGIASAENRLSAIAMGQKSIAIVMPTLFLSIRTYNYYASPRAAKS